MEDDGSIESIRSHLLSDDPTIFRGAVASARFKLDRELQTRYHCNDSGQMGLEELIGREEIRGRLYYLLSKALRMINQAQMHWTDPKLARKRNKRLPEREEIIAATRSLLDFIERTGEFVEITNHGDSNSGPNAKSPSAALNQDKLTSFLSIRELGGYFWWSQEKAESREKAVSPHEVQVSRDGRFTGFTVFGEEKNFLYVYETFSDKRVFLDDVYSIHPFAFSTDLKAPVLAYAKHHRDNGLYEFRSALIKSGKNYSALGAGSSQIYQFPNFYDYRVRIVATDFEKTCVLGIEDKAGLWAFTLGEDHPRRIPLEIDVDVAVVRFLSPTILCSGDNDGTVFTLNLATNTGPNLLGRHKSNIADIRGTCDSRGAICIVSASNDGDIKLWSADDNGISTSNLGYVRGHPACVSMPLCYENRIFVLVICKDSSIYLCEKDQRPLLLTTLVRNIETITSASISYDTRVLAGIIYDKQLVPSIRV